MVDFLAVSGAAASVVEVAFADVFGAALVFVATVGGCMDGGVTIRV